MKRFDWQLRGKHLMVAAALVFLTGCGDKRESKGDFDSLLRTADEDMQRGRYREAVATLEKAVNVTPNAAQPYMKLALIYEECLHDGAAALRYYRKYQEVERDAVKREEVAGWISQLERAVGGGKSAAPGSATPTGMLVGDRGGVGELKAVTGERIGASAPSISVEESAAYKELEAKLASALREIRELRAEGSSASASLGKLAESQRKVAELEREKESLGKELREAKVASLRSQQVAEQAEKAKEALRNSYEAQVADFKKRLSSAEERLRDMEATAEGKRRSQLLKELRDAKRERDLLQAQYSSAAKEIAELKKRFESYSATVSSLQKVNDGLRREVVSLRARLPGAGGAARSYTVREGDTLKKIAALTSVYGDSRKWIVIYQANREKIRDPNRLQRGLVLVIPAE